jgi:hypothetical protein
MVSSESPKLSKPFPKSSFIARVMLAFAGVQRVEGISSSHSAAHLKLENYDYVYKSVAGSITGSKRPRRLVLVVYDI